MSDIADRRSLDDIVEDILSALVPLKQDDATARQAIVVVARNVQFMGPHIRKTGALSTIRKRAEEALRAMDALVEVCGYLGDSEELQHVHNMIDMLAQLKKAPHPNTNVLQLALVRLAASLVAQYSLRGISTSKDGNVHVTAKCLCEIATGQRATPAQMLDTVWKAFPRRVMRFNE
jgi:hypothetical protein